MINFNSFICPFVDALSEMHLLLKTLEERCDGHLFTNEETEVQALIWLSLAPIHSQHNLLPFRVMVSEALQTKEGNS